MEYNFDIVYQAGLENIIPDFFSRIYVLYTIKNSKQDNKDILIAKQKNKICIPLGNKTKLILDTHRTYTSHMQLAKLYTYLCRRYY